MKRVLLVGLSATLIAAQVASPAAAAYTDVEFEQIEAYVAAGDWVSLREFLLDKPALLQGNDPFTEELRRFVEGTTSLYTVLTFEPRLFPDLDEGSAEGIAPSLPTRAATPPPSGGGDTQSAVGAAAAATPALSQALPSIY